MRIGIYGGSFNPVHMAHLLLAECCREQLQLDRVIFVPAARPPHKPDLRLAPSADRIAMLELAIAGVPEFVISREEIDRAEFGGEPGWMFVTVENLQRSLHTATGNTTTAGEPHQWFLLVGADMFEDLPRWYRAAELLQLVTPIGVHRPGWPEPDAMRYFTSLVGESLAAEIAAAQCVTMPQVELSSTELRHRITDGRSLRWRTPAAVECYIHQHDIYRETSSGER